MLRKKYILALTGALLSALVSGCLSVSSERIRTQVLQPADSNPPKVADRLVSFDVSISYSDLPLKLYSVQIYNITTGEPWNLTFFKNSFIDSNEIHAEVDKHTVRHTVITNLPAATYQIRKIKLVGSLSRAEQQSLTAPDIIQTFEHEPATPLFFTVDAAAEAQYLGALYIMLNTHIDHSQRDFGSSALAATQYQGMPAVAANAMHTETQTLRGMALIDIKPPTDELIASLQERYPATAALTFVKGRMWTD